MKRASTPTHRFELMTDLSALKDIMITYKQGDKIVLEKARQDVTMEGKTAVVKLTQEETNLFAADTDVKLQVRILTLGGESYPSNVVTVPVEDVLNDEVMV